MNNRFCIGLLLTFTIFFRALAPSHETSVEVCAVSFAPNSNNQILVVLPSDGVFYVYDAASGHALRQIVPQRMLQQLPIIICVMPHKVVSLRGLEPNRGSLRALCPDEFDEIFSFLDTRSVLTLRLCCQSLRALHDESVQHRFRGFPASHPGEIQSAAFSQCGNFLVAGSGGEIKVWQRNGACLTTLPRQGGSIACPVAVCSRGSMLLIITAEDTGPATLSTIDSNTGLVREEGIFQKPDFEICLLALSPDCSCILAADAYRKAALWERETASHGDTLTMGSPIKSVVFASDGTLFAIAAGEECDVRHTANPIETAVCSFGGPGSQELSAVAFSPDSKFIVLARARSPILIYCVSAEDRFSPGDLVASLHCSPPRAPFANVRNVAFMADGNKLAIAEQSGAIRVVSAADGRLLQWTRVAQGCVPSNEHNPVVISPDVVWVFSSSGTTGCASTLGKCTFSEHFGGHNENFS